MEALVREGIVASSGLSYQAQQDILTATSDYLAQKRMAFWQVLNTRRLSYAHP